MSSRSPLSTSNVLVPFPTGLHELAECPYDDFLIWSPWLDSNQRLLPSKGSTLTRLSYTEIVWYTVRVSISSHLLERQVATPAASQCMLNRLVGSTGALCQIEVLGDIWRPAQDSNPHVSSYAFEWVEATGDSRAVCSINLFLVQLDQEHIVWYTTRVTIPSQLFERQPATPAASWCIDLVGCLGIEPSSVFRPRIKSPVHSHYVSIPCSSVSGRGIATSLTLPSLHQSPRTVGGDLSMLGHYALTVASLQTGFYLTSQGLTLSSSVRSVLYGPRTDLVCDQILESPVGFEPTPYGLEDRCATANTMSSLLDRRCGLAPQGHDSL